jgi:hypothetical protein
MGATRANEQEPYGGIIQICHRQSEGKSDLNRVVQRPDQPRVER